MSGCMSGSSSGSPIESRRLIGCVVIELTAVDAVLSDEYLDGLENRDVHFVNVGAIDFRVFCCSASSVFSDAIFFSNACSVHRMFLRRYL